MQSYITKRGSKPEISKIKMKVKKMKKCGKREICKLN